MAPTWSLFTNDTGSVADGNSFSLTRSYKGFEPTAQLPTQNDMINPDSQPAYLAIFIISLYSKLGHYLSETLDIMTIISGVSGSILVFVFVVNKFVNTGVKIDTSPNMTIQDKTSLCLEEKAELTRERLAYLTGKMPIKTPDFIPEKDRYTPNSPYTDSDHQSDLWDFNWQDACMLLALKNFDAIRIDYARVPYTEAFNLAEVMEVLKIIVGDKISRFEERRYFIVAFRSQLKDLDVYDDLSALDKGAHAEATRFKIMKYWYGSPDSGKHNLATCFWPSREHAGKASHCPAHNKAIRAGTPMYSWYKVECYEMVVTEGISNWTFEPIEIRGH